jgi:tetratricopeptide (TPR) repeat protein
MLKNPGHVLERDFAAAEQIPADYTSKEFPPPMRDPKAYYRGQVALARGDTASAQSFFEKARPFFELRVQDHPDDPVFLGPLGMLYAFMGRKQEAINASRRAVELVPPNKNAADAPYYQTMLAIAYAWTGEIDEAIAMLPSLLTTPGGLIWLNFVCDGSLTRCEMIRGSKKSWRRRNRKRSTNKEGPVKLNT